jgi:hypothetical protein
MKVGFVKSSRWPDAGFQFDDPICAFRINKINANQTSKVSIP